MVAINFDLLSVFICVIFLVFVFKILKFFGCCEGMPHVVRYEDENYFVDFSNNPPKKKLFPKLQDSPSLHLSVIVPAYNEENRLPKMLNECLQYLEERVEIYKSFNYEVIIVDDGSSDSTTKVSHSYSKKYGSEKVRVLTLVKNRGKGGAVRLGVMSCRGKFILFADADGATKFRDFQKLEVAMNDLVDSNPDAVVVGSRAHLNQQAVATRSFFRNLLMYGFHTLVWLFGIRKIHDTQCGFKLFTRNVALFLFQSLHVERWAFDVELLYIAIYSSIRVREVAVNWTEIEGSKLIPFWSWLQMGKDIVQIWLKYQIGFWKVPEYHKHT